MQLLPMLLPHYYCKVLCTCLRPFISRVKLGCMCKLVGAGMQVLCLHKYTGVWLQESLNALAGYLKTLLLHLLTLMYVLPNIHDNQMF